MEVKVFCVKVEKARIAKIQDNINHELDKVEGACRRADIAGITYVVTSDGDACMIGIIFLRSDLTQNYGVEKLFSSLPRGIFKSKDTEGVRSIHVLVPGSLLSFSNSLAQSAEFIGGGHVPYVRKLRVLAELAVL